jgi:hypothetical protein
MLVEPDGADGPDFFATERYAGAHAGYVLNSWGTPEFAGESADDRAFSDPGVSYFASTPDMPDQTQYPATSPNVVAVGGDESVRSNRAMVRIDLDVSRRWVTLWGVHPNFLAAVPREGHGSFAAPTA